MGAKQLESTTSLARTPSPTLEIHASALHKTATASSERPVPSPTIGFGRPARRTRSIDCERGDSRRPSTAESDPRQPSREVQPVGAMWSGEIAPMMLSDRTIRPPPRHSIASLSTDEDDAPYVPPQPRPPRPQRVRSVGVDSRRTSNFISDDDRSAFTPSPTLVIGRRSLSPTPSPARRVPS